MGALGTDHAKVNEQVDASRYWSARVYRGSVVLGQAPTPGMVRVVVTTWPEDCPDDLGAYADETFYVQASDVQAFNAWAISGADEWGVAGSIWVWGATRAQVFEFGKRLPIL